MPIPSQDTCFGQMWETIFELNSLKSYCMAKLTEGQTQATTIPFHQTGQGVEDNKKAYGGTERGKEHVHEQRHIKQDVTFGAGVRGGR